jgi:hypothetical protein
MKGLQRRAATSDSLPSIGGTIPGLKSIKVEVKKKHSSGGWRFSCFAAHLFEQGLF